jgi:hypothetical protein
MDVRRLAQSLLVAASVAVAVLLLSSGLSVSGANAPRERSLAGHEPALGAYAARGPVDVPDGMWYDATTGTVRGDVLETDAGQIAKSEGLGVDEAVSRLRAQQRMDEILGKAEDLYPELVGIRWMDGRVVAQFKGRAPDAALELLRTARAEVGYELVRYSAAELGQLQTDLGKVLTGMGVTDFAVALDPTGQRIIASVSTTSEARSPDGAAISKQSIAAALPSNLAGANVDIQLADQPIAQPTTTYGGTDARIGTFLQCTNGFTVVSNTITGVATDSHCGTSLSYRDWVTGITHTMSYVNGHIGTWGDMAWFTTSGNEVDDFYADEVGNRRDVTATETTIVYGSDFVWFGRATNNNYSSWVRYPSVDTSGPKKLACLDGGPPIPGDSGGPVYITTKAGGFIWGWIDIDGAHRLCFSQARYIDDALVVTIMH